jgi:hypothetical protein
VTRPIQDPVLIAGVLRSGVRLLASILDGHPLLGSGPELPFMVTMARQWQELRATLGENHARHYQLSPEDVRARFRASALEIVMPRARHARKARFVLHSFAASVSLEALAELFPQAKIILTLRDPRDVVRSLLGCDWRNPRDGQPLPYVQDAAAAAKLWSDFTEIAMRSVPALEARRRLIRLRYEDLCLRPQDTMDRLGAFLEIEPPRAIVEAASAAAVTASLGNPHPALRVGAIDDRSVGPGRTALNQRDLAAVESATLALRQRLGYR